MTAAQSAAMSDHLVRVEKLRAFQKAMEWNDAELARQCGRSQQQVHSWFTNSRMIGERLARALEDKLGLSRYALDERPGTSVALQVSEATPHEGGSKTVAEQVTKRARDVPIINWAELAAMLDEENAVIRGNRPSLETYAAASNKAKFLAMPDDSMSPDVQQGDHLLFDPTEAPRAGDVVLVRCGAEYFVRSFRPRTAYVFEALAQNQNYQPLNSKDDGLAVVGVMVEHRKYRRPSP